MQAKESMIECNYSKGKRGNRNENNGEIFKIF